MQRRLPFLVAALAVGALVTIAPASAAPNTPSVIVTVPGATAADSASEPPDVSVAVGAGRVVELVNGAGRIWTTTGAVVSSTSPEQTFGTGDDLSDPRILFDPATNRWYTSILDLTNGNVLIGVSRGADPSPGQWTRFDIPTGACPDQPKIGFSDTLIVVAADVFSTCSGSGNFLGNEVWVYDKAALLSGAVTSPAFSRGPDRAHFSIQPAPNTGAAAFGIETDGSRVRLMKVASAAAGSISFTAVPLQKSIEDPPGSSAIQPGGHIDEGDSRVAGVAWQNNTLFFSATNGCTPPGASAPRVCADYGAVSSAGALLWQSELSTATGDFLYPAIQPDGNGSVLSVVGFTSDAAPPQLLAYSLDSAGGFSAPAVLAQSGAPYSGSRWGDYFGMAIDPANPGVVWGGGEVGPPAGSRNNWQTSISALGVVAAPPPPPGPTVKALTSSGSRRGIVRLRFRVADVSGKAKEHVSVARGAKTVFTARVPLGEAKSGQVYFVEWRPPRKLAVGLYTFCLDATNPSGVTSRSSCATIRVTA